MGKTDGFLEYRRVMGGAQAARERVQHYQEFHTDLPDHVLREQAARCMDCGTPFCHGAGCPLGNCIPEFNELVYQNRWREAAERLHLTSNFPEITGRVCPALCEASCVVSIDAGAVTIRQIELAIVERAWQEGWIQPLPPAQETGKRIAVVGSGPAGLAAAQQLRRAGHKVVLYERDNRIGGLLRYGIPDFKLEKRILDRRLAQMEAEGVDFRCDVDVGRDLSADYLHKRYDAICLCVGARVPRDLTIPGRDLGGIHFAVPYLTQQIRRNSGDAVAADEAILATDKRVVIIGGGDTSNDCLGTALRQGAAHVEQLEILPKAPADRDQDKTPWPMWPHMFRPSNSHAEGGEQRWCVTATSFIGAEGQVRAVQCVGVEWKQGKDGRLAPQHKKGSEFEIQADLVLLAMGFTQPEHDGLLDALGVDYDARGNVQSDDMHRTNVETVFAAGDAQSGAWLVVGAMAAGRRMARAVDLQLMGESALPDTVPPPKLYAYAP